MIRYLTIDVEAVAIADVETYLEPVTAPSNYRDPEKIAAYEREARAAAIARAALDVDLARIVALGIKRDDGATDVLRCYDEAGERYALRTLWGHFEHARPQLVTFNGLGYDVPLLMRRSLYLGLWHPQIQCDRFKHPQVVDVMAILSMDGKLKSHGLRFYANRFGLPVQDEITGKEIAQCVAEGDWASVERHCRSDVDLTWQLAQRIGAVRLPVPEQAF